MANPTDEKLEKQLCEALGTPAGSGELPDPLLNARLKAKLYQVQDAKETENQAVRKIPLWYLPALLNIIGNLAFCLAAAVFSSGIVKPLVFGFSVYASLGGVVLTAAGARCASWKDSMTLVLYQHRKNNKKGGIGS